MSLMDVAYKPMTRKIPNWVKQSNYETIPSSYTSSTINGYIGSRNQFEQMIAGKWSIKVQYRFYSDTPCNHGDLIIFDSKNYRVIGEPQNTLGLTHHYKSWVEHCTNVD